LGSLFRGDWRVKEEVPDQRAKNEEAASMIARGLAFFILTIQVR
jgi:hypothetical protein